jgi:hypothetical protein
VSARDLRPEIAEDFARLYRDGVKRLEEAVSREGAYTGKCPNCRRDVRVDNVPPIRDIVLALQFLADQGIGKPSTQPAKPDKPQEALAELTQASDEELARIASTAI